MEMSSILGSKRSKVKANSSPGDPAREPGIHIYLFWTKEGERFLSHTCEEVTAEELCIRAAKAVGISPLCHVLFALYNHQSQCWHSPKHIFKLEDTSSLVLHYRLRFYFRNWHRLNDKEPIVSRYVPKSGKDEGISHVLEATSLDYLFAQAKHDFIHEAVPMEEIKSEEELSSFKSEWLGMAVLHLSHHAVKLGCTLQEVGEKMSFLECIPRSFKKHISGANILTKIRIKRVFRNFVHKFQQHTVDNGRLGTYEIIYKYISTFEQMAPTFGTETFLVLSLELRDELGENCSFSGTPAQGALKDCYGASTTYEVMVTGTKGIHWREQLSTQKAKNNNYLMNGPDSYTGMKKQQSSQTVGHEKASNEWTFFCDFPFITHIALNDANVSIFTRDNRCMVVQLNSSQEACSFISLLDGYYRLTADAHHYLCHEVAPSRVVLSEANGLHGPMHADFVLSKLQKEALEDGAFLIRWSAFNYDLIILAVLSREHWQNEPTASHKQFQIQHNGSTFNLEGWEGEFSTIKELTDSLKNFVLKSGSESFMVKKCCFPRHGELSNLMVMRQGAKLPAHGESSSQLRFHPIKERQIVKGQHLGRGTRTNIFAAQLLVQGDGDSDDDDEFNNNPKGIPVVLKILDQKHKDIALAFFETASLMSQVSHSHLVFVHGVSVKDFENTMVEEFVEFGPLDDFLQKEKASVTPQWKFSVTKQLASALNYLDTRGLVHGNVCGKNILVARRGLEQGTTPFIKLSDPGFALNVLSRDERIERIPWIAPECVDSGVTIRSASDQWSFGATLLEICSNGELPMSGCSLSEKERFYQQKCRLPEPPSQDLARFISKCLDYEPAERPSFPIILRDLLSINPDMSPIEAPAGPGSGLFHKRYLKKICKLGEGNFGKVHLYMYDPQNDYTGEHVAVKELKQGSGNVKSWMKEIDILKSLSHNNIVKYKGCCTESGEQIVQLIMEYLPLGSLKDYLYKCKPGMARCLLFAQQICEGMEYLHTMRYVHRDLAARNVLVENDRLVKIGDFGLTKSIPEGQLYYRVIESEDSPVYWYAIECLKENKFSFSSDVWSFGVTLYEILTRCNPAEHPRTKYTEMIKPADGTLTLVLLINHLERNMRLPCPRDCLPEVKVLMEQCWAADRSVRPPFSCLIEKFKELR